MGNIQTDRIHLDDDNITYELKIKKDSKRTNTKIYCDCLEECDLCCRQCNYHRCRRHNRKSDKPSWCQ